MVTFNTMFVNSPYIVIWHRNHLGVLSAYPIGFVAPGVYSYDFTIPAGQAYLNGQKDLGSGIYGMFGGDAAPDGLIDINDKNLWTDEAGNTGYKAEDFNLDTQVDNKDKDDIWVPNEGEGTKVPN
ncbi:MAG: hypothetical protein DRJ05_15125 [Bacteroidetes bacterium]|nr:MAG: hypothetical protein DRJ05_15125 [Bacteroidota bacterium]